MKLPVLDFNRVKDFDDAQWANFHKFMPHLHVVIQMSMLAEEEDNQAPRPADDIVITCDLCANAQWWADNFGSLADAARWFYCGILGLNCPVGGG